MMSLDERLGNFFKAEVKASGRRLLAEDKISITGGSDTTLLVYVRASPPLRVLLESEGVDQESFTAGCSCPMGKKAQFCKHVWGALLGAELKFPDFLAAKRSIGKPAIDLSQESSTDSYAETAKLRASEYRKAQYQKSKAQAKNLKKERKARDDAPSIDSYPEDVAAALSYFLENGFPMESGPSEEIASEAKRKLSRIFHPDKGGTHAEILELNQNCEIILRFLGR
jgi:hypothetical protein